LGPGEGLFQRQLPVRSVPLMSKERWEWYERKLG
jgi:hypothetical protein